MPNPTLTAAIDKIAAGSDLSANEAADVLGEIMADEASEIEIAMSRTALRMRTIVLITAASPGPGPGLRTRRAGAAARRRTRWCRHHGR